MAFSFPAFSYIIALIVDAFLIFFSIFHVIAFDELKTDYKNPIDQCNSLNPLVLPEYLLHLFINILFLLSGEWFSLLVNVPLILYHIHRYRTRPVMSGPGLYDPTSIMNADVLTICQREGWIKLAFYLLSFFLYLYGEFLLDILPWVSKTRQEKNRKWADNHKNNKKLIANQPAQQAGKHPPIRQSMGEYDCGADSCLKVEEYSL